MGIAFIGIAHFSELYCTIILHLYYIVLLFCLSTILYYAIPHDIVEILRPNVKKVEAAENISPGALAQKKTQPSPSEGV